MTIMTLDKFYNRVVITAQLIAVTPIHIGGRVDSFKPGEINGSFIKDIYGRPYIPGSSLKGILRAFLSAVMKDPIESEASKNYVTKEDRAKHGTSQELAESIYEASTKTERLFGSTLMAGKIKVADAMPSTERIETEIRNGVAIERDTHTALGGALFDTEVVPAGSAFNFIASAENLNSCEADIFGELLEYFADGNITLGGRSRAGLGVVELVNIKLKIFKPTHDGFPSSTEVKCSKNNIREEVCKCLQN